MKRLLTILLWLLAWGVFGAAAPPAVLRTTWTTNAIPTNAVFYGQVIGTASGVTTNALILTGGGGGLLDGTYTWTNGAYVKNANTYITNHNGIWGIDYFGWSDVETNTLPIGTYYPGIGWAALGTPSARYRLDADNLDSASLSPWGTDINANTHSLTNLDTLALSGGGDSNVVIEVSGGGSITFSNAVTGSTFRMTLDGNLWGNGGSLTNINADAARFRGTNGVQTVYNINTFFLTESNTMVGVDPISAATTSPCGQYGYTNKSGVDVFFTPTNLPASPNVVIYKTNWSATKEIWVCRDYAQALTLFTLTNDSNPSIFPQGPWFPSVADLEDITQWNLDPIIATNGRLYATIISSVTAPMAQQAREALRYHPPHRNSVLAGRPLVELTQGGPPRNLETLTNMVKFVLTNNYQSFIDVITMDRWVDASGTSRDSTNNQIFDQIDFPGMTIADYTDYLHTNGLLAGLHFDSGMYGTNGNVNNGDTGSQGFYHQDATNAVANGLDFVLLDSTAPAMVGEKNQDDLIVEFTRSFYDAGIQYKRPIFVMGANAGYSVGQFRDWMPMQDAWWFGADYGAGMFGVVEQSVPWTGHGRYPILCNPGAEYCTNYSGARKFFGLASIAPAHIQVFTEFFTTNVMQTCTNLEMQDIWRDSAQNAGWLLSSNAVGEVWARYLANGDIAVFFADLGGAGGSLTLNWTDLNISTNVSMVCRDVFEATNVVKTIGFTRALEAHEGSLWRLSRGTAAPMTTNLLVVLADTGITNQLQFKDGKLIGVAPQ